MTNPEQDIQDEKPLDPAMELVRRKMIRLQIVSASVMFLSLMAVFGAVVYKMMKSDPKPQAAASSSMQVPSDEPLIGKITLPADFTVQSVSLSQDRMLFFGQTGSERKAMVFDIATGQRIADIAVVSP